MADDTQPVQTSGLIRVRLGFNVGQLVAWVDAEQVEELIASAQASDQVVPTLLVVERLDWSPA